MKKYTNFFLLVVVPAVLAKIIMYTYDEDEKRRYASQQETLDAKPFYPVFYSEKTPIKEYEKNDFIKLLEWVKRETSTSGKIDEYTTTEKKNAILKEVKYKIKSLPSLAVEVPCKKTYNADSGAMNVEIMSSAEFKEGGNVFAGNQFYQLNVKSFDTEKGKYNAQNGFGANTEVTEMEGEYYSLIYEYGDEPIQLIKVSNIYAHTHSNMIMMLPETAKSNRDFIACLSIFKIIEPYTYNKIQTIKPTRTSPIDATFRNFGIHSTIDGIIFYNKKTGEIYKKFFRDGFNG